GSLITSGLFTWGTGGEMAGSGQTTTNGSLVITCDNGSELDGRTLNINGGATLTGVSSQLLRAINGAVVNNAGLFDVLSDLTFFEPGGSSHPTFNNLATGTFRKSAGTGATNVAIAVNKNGAIEVDNGTVNLMSGGTSTGSFTVAATTTLDFSGGTQNLILNAGSSISGDGTVRFSGANANLNGGSYAVGNTVIAGGAANFNVTSSTTTL